MSSTTVPATEAPAEARKPGKGSAFWLTFLAIVVTTFLGALDLSAVGTALPTIAKDLNGGDEFAWIGSAYALSSTAFLPLSGALADVLGRRPVMIGAILFFTLGSALAGAAQSMHWLIAARTIQGVGGGAIINLGDIITSDLVPLAERGLYQGLVGLTWAFACGVGPPIGGAFAGNASWRWLFYLNLPLTGISLFLVFFFLRVRTPEGSIKSKLARVDWIGNLIIVAGTALAIVGLTLGGGQFPWTSPKVLAPLIIGFVILGISIIYESKVPREPTIPLEILSNRTTVSGYIATLIQGITSISVVYYLVVYFQACLGDSPVKSGVDVLTCSLFVAFFALLGGIIVQASNRYVPANIAGWVLMLVGFGVLSLMKVGDSTAKWVGYQVLVGAGIGLLFPAPMFAVLAPLPVERNATALAFFAFVRTFAQTWGITISSTILQNELTKRLPEAFVEQISGGGRNIAYGAIPLIKTLQDPLRTQVRVAFAESLSTVWKTMIGIGGIGLLSLLLMKEIPMSTATNEKFGLHEGQNANQDELVVEKGSPTTESRIPVLESKEDAQP